MQNIEYPHEKSFIAGSLAGGIDWGNNSLTDLNGITSLSYIGGDLNIYSNQNLETLIGLDNLTTISGGTIAIQFNHSLTSLAGLNNLNSSNVHIRIDHNDGLENLTGLECLTSTGGFYIGYNDGLKNFSGSVSPWAS